MAELTVVGQSAEVLLQTGHLDRRVGRLGADVLWWGITGGQVGVGGVQARGLRGDAAGHLSHTQEGFDVCCVLEVFVL